MVRWRREAGIDTAVDWVLTPKREDCSLSALVNIGVDGWAVAGILADECEAVGAPC